MKFLITLLAFLLAAQLLAQVNLQSSNLPILVIATTDGEDIPDEPKIDAHLGIIWNGDGAVNQINDPFNGYDGLIGIELRGSSSQALFPKVGYAFETRLPDGSNHNVPLLGFPAENDWVLHGPYSDKTLMRNALAYILAGWIMDYAPRVKFCEVVLNGDYRGVYILTEKIKRDDNRVDIATLNPDETSGDDLTGGYILKFDKWDGADNSDFPSAYPAFPGRTQPTYFLHHYPKPGDLVQEQQAYIQEWIGEMENVLASDQFADSLTGYRRYFDLPAFYQFLFIQEMARNVDGYRLSTFFSKDRDSDGGKLKMGPVWDFNLGFGNVDYCTGPGVTGWALEFNDFCPGDNWVIHFWWDRMWSDEAFRHEMADYWSTLRANELSNERIFHLVDSLENLLQQPAQRNFQRWPVLGEWVWPNDFIGNTHAEEVAHLRQWLENRLAWMDGAFSFFLPTAPVSNSFVEPKVMPNPSDGGFTFEYWALFREVVLIDIFDAQGRLVRQLEDRSLAGGKRTSTLDDELPQGLYFYRMQFSRGKTASGRLVRQ